MPRRQDVVGGGEGKGVSSICLLAKTFNIYLYNFKIKKSENMHILFRLSRFFPCPRPDSFGFFRAFITFSPLQFWPQQNAAKRMQPSAGARKKPTAIATFLVKTKHSCNDLSQSLSEGI